MNQGQFTFNDPSGACPTCAGIGTAMRVHPALLVPDPTRSLNQGAFVTAAFSNNRDIAEVLVMSVEDGVKFFADEPRTGLHFANSVGRSELAFVARRQNAPIAAALPSRRSGGEENFFCRWSAFTESGHFVVGNDCVRPPIGFVYMLSQ